MTTPTALPISTQRLTVRNLVGTDIDRFVAYRNDPEVARFQEWPIPYPSSDAEAMVLDQAGLTGPVPGRWVQLAIDDGTGIVGDVAIGLDVTGSLATIGYTLAPAAQGRGYATEAVGALLAMLFSSGVHRAQASLDPANLASARVLERLGFRWEGCALAASHVRGEWLDDDRWGLLAAEFRAWRDRPRHRPRQVRLVEIPPGGARPALALAGHRSQQDFVASVAESYADALVPEVIGGAPMRPWIRLIEADGELAGFVMVAEPIDPEPVTWLWRLLIDRRHQGRGIGRSAVDLVLDHVRSTGADRIRTSWVDGPGSPGPFHLANGFVPTGEIEDGEIVAELRLDQPAG